MSRFSLKSSLLYASLGVCSTAVVSLSGCAGATGTAAPSSLDMTIPAGAVHGGQQPIQGAHIYVMAANTTGTYKSASTSLLHSGTPGTADDSIGTYVTTDANGGFSYAGMATCPAPTTQIYLLATGGNPTGFQGGPSNPAIALTAALGSCSTINSSTFTSMNEVTTVAMAFALDQFMADGTHVGAPASNTAGLLNAFANVAELASSSTGTALAQTPGGNGVAPQRTLNTLANVIAPCANSIGSSSSACTQLFSLTTTGSSTPTNVLGAALNLAAFPGLQMATLYSIATATAPFQPTLTAQPNDFALGITYHAPTTTVQPSAVAIDASGNLWVANCQSCLNPAAVDSLVVYGPNGAYLHTYTGSNTPGAKVLHHVVGIAFDAAGSNLYTVNQGISGGTVPGTGDDQVIKISTTTGLVQSGFPVDFDQATYGLNTFQYIAIDNSGEVWATASNTGAVVEMTPTGFLINGSPFFIGPNIGVGTDNLGNIWLAGGNGENLLQWDTFGDFLANYTPSSLNNPVSIALNQSNQILTVNTGNKSVTMFDPNVGPGGTDTAYTSIGVFGATMAAIDGQNQILIPNCRASCVGSGSALPDNVLRLSSSGVPNTGGTSSNYGAQVSTLSGANSAAIDASGNVWVTDNVSGNLTEVIGYAAPTRQPLAAASLSGKIGQRP